MKQLQLKDLYNACKKEMEAGNGEKYLITGDDNECKGYHGIYFAISPITKKDAEYIIPYVYDSVEKKPENLLIVG